MQCTESVRSLGEPAHLIAGSVPHGDIPIRDDSDAVTLTRVGDREGIYMRVRELP